MPQRILTITFMFLMLIASSVMADDDLGARIEAALERAGDNAGQLREALEKTPDDQRQGMRFLIAYMPERDLESLTAQYLLDNVNYAYLAWRESPWKDQISNDMFLNDILPYASINERRDNWRKDFYERFKPLVAEAKTPGEAAVILNQKIFPMLNVHFSRERLKADQSPYETIETGKASCTGLTVLLIDACRAVGVPARFAGTPLWVDHSGNHSWVEVWDGQWHFTGAAEPSGDKLNQGWFAGKARTAQGDHRFHAIYATSFKQTDTTFPLPWLRRQSDIYAVNVTDRYAPAAKADVHQPAAVAAPGFDVEASLHAVDQLGTYLAQRRDDRPALGEQDFASVPLTRKDARTARQLLWKDHAEHIRAARAKEMESRVITEGDKTMPFFYSVTGEKPEGGRSLYISLHGGGGAPDRVNNSQWENQKRLYQVPEGVYLAPRAPTNTWDLWHQGHIDVMFDRLIENLIVLEDVNPNRVYVLGYSAGGDGVYRLAPRMADRWAAASMMAGHPGNASPVNLRNTPFSIHAGEKDTAYNRNEVARSWGAKLDTLHSIDPGGYIHWTKIYEGKGHWLEREDAAAIPWMAKFTRNPYPAQVVWRQENHPRFYWLAVNELNHGAVVRATLIQQTIDLQSDSTKNIIIRVNDRMMNLDEDIVVMSGGRKVYEGRIPRTIATMAKTLEERGDPSSTFSGEIIVALAPGE